MAHLLVRDRVAEIHGPGTLLVSSDLHGNLNDLRRLRTLWEAEDDAVLLLLGDLFHGPSVDKHEWLAELDHLGDWYPDESPALLDEVGSLLARHPDRIVSLLGNHDHAHLGGPVVAKFYPDEAAALDERLTEEQRASLRRMVRNMPLIAASACGVAFVHAAPPAHHFDRHDLRKVSVDRRGLVPPLSESERVLLADLLWRRHASEHATQQFLQRLRAAGTPGPCTVVVHGHEIARAGYEVENQHLVNLSTSFGMKRADRTYLRLDLARSYPDAASLRPGHELLPLYP